MLGPLIRIANGVVMDVGGKSGGDVQYYEQVSAPKTSLAANARRNNEKAFNILLSAIPDRHLLSFHDAVDARSTTGKP
ncbi:hypothetical protein Tco_0951811 [Tanacetum coccineum]|uniref:Uncharacterized protein n=1 Tax=Tanacetum coccineum TaxID=301880 RepID=A0ABQ5DXZ9_9ASTR